MKRFFKYLGAVLAGALVLSSCVEEEKIVFNPEAGAAQVLGEIHGCTLEAEGPAIETTYAEVDFGVDVPVVYTLNIAASGAEEINTKLSATIAKEKISFAQKDLNAAILNMGGAADVEFAVDFQLVASMANDKGTAIKGDESYVKYSNVVTAKFVPYSTTVLDVDKYDHLWVIGAAESIGAWAHDKVYQYLYNYSGDGKTYTGMIYYTDGAAGGWKITGIAGWDDSCNWGSADNSADEAEAPSLKLISSGGSQDIKCYANPYYMWTFNKESLELKKEFGFTTMSIVGSFNNWNAADESCVMTYNAYYHRFYIDYEFTADGELKFAADGAWDLNFGDAMAINGGNIPVAAGKYRIYLDFNKNEYTFDANMYGKEEPGAAPVTPEPEPEPDPTLPEGARAINILCENPGWETANLYGWEAATSFSWPGIVYTGVATLGGAEYFYWTLEAANWGKTPGLIFNNGSVQTVDITGVTLDGDKSFRLTAAGTDGKLGYEAIECPVIKITYKNEAGWDTVSMYGWGDLGDFGGWPGAPMTKDGDVWVYELPVEHLGKSTSLIFNNAGAGAQTVDLGPFVLTEDLVFDNSNAAIK